LQVRPVTYTGVEPLKGASLREAEDLLTNNIIGLKRLSRDKHSSLVQKFKNYGQKSFMIFAPGTNVKKLFSP
jgi:hypothetical protein